MERVLVIDDDGAIRQFISGFLVEAGYEVELAQDGEEGIELLKKDSDFKVVITDIRMPRKDGNEVAKYVKHSLKEKDIPVVAITGYMDDAETELFHCMFEKPFKMKALIEVIDSFQSKIV